MNDYTTTTIDKTTTRIDWGDGYSMILRWHESGMLFEVETTNGKMAYRDMKEAMKAAEEGE